MKHTIKTDLNKLNSIDIYSMMLFILFKLKDESKYSMLSELVYMFNDKDTLYNFLMYYGGQTIKIPTLNELKIVINALLLFDYINIEGMTFEEGLAKIENQELIEEIKSCYKEISEIMCTYNFNRC